jgi:hypothetical protein
MTHRGRFLPLGALGGACAGLREMAPHRVEGPVPVSGYVVPSEALHDPPGRSEGPVTLSVPTPSQRVVVERLAVGFDHQPRLRPMEVHLQCLTTELESSIYQRTLDPSLHDPSEEAHLELASRTGQLVVPCAKDRGQARDTPATAVASSQAVQLEQIEDFEPNRPFTEPLECAPIEHGRLVRIVRATDVHGIPATRESSSSLRFAPLCTRIPRRERPARPRTVTSIGPSRGEDRSCNALAA